MNDSNELHISVGPSEALPGKFEASITRSAAQHEARGAPVWSVDGYDSEDEAWTDATAYLHLELRNKIPALWRKS